MSRRRMKAPSGAFNCCREVIGNRAHAATGGAGRGALHDAEVVAALASVVLARACTEREPQRVAHSRSLIGQAQGMLMQRYGLSAEVALTLLRHYSQLHNTKMVVLAEQFTTTGRLPDFSEPHPRGKP